MTTARAESDYLPHPDTVSVLKDIAALRQLIEQSGPKVTPEAAILSRWINTQVESLWRQQR